MENASKALIVAGAVLIAILLISIAILIINSTGSVTDQTKSQGDSMAIQMFNAQFDTYMGKNLSTTEVKNLFRLIISNNSSNSEHLVKLNFISVTKDSYNSSWYKYILKAETDATKIANKISEIDNNHNYSATVSSSKDGYKDGYIQLIYVYKRK